MPTKMQRPPGEDEGIAGGGADPRRSSFARAFAEALHDSGISQSELSTRSGVAQPTLSQWKNGHITPETPDTVFAVERALGTAPGFLSRHLGYLPIEAVPADWRAGLARDPNVDDTIRRAILAIIEKFEEAGDEGA